MKERNRLQADVLYTFCCTIFSFISLIPLISILCLILSNGLPFLVKNLYHILCQSYDVSPCSVICYAMIGTIIMVTLAVLLALPFGILGAIYLNEYNSVSPFSQFIELTAKLLTAFPSIFFGLFIYLIFVKTTHHFSAIAGALALFLLILPMLLLTAKQSLDNIPKSYKEAALALGSTRFQTIFHVLLPESFPQITVGLMLVIARASGETAPLLFTAFFSQYPIHSFFEPIASLSLLIYNFSSLPDKIDIDTAWSAALILTSLVMVTNILANFFLRKQKFKHKKKIFI